MAGFEAIGAGVGSVDVHQLRRDIDELAARLDALQPKLERQNRGLQTQISLLTSALSLSQRLTGDENLERGLMILQRAILLVQQLHVSSTLLMATNPWLWGLGLINIAGMAVTTIGMSDMVTGY